MTIKSVMMQQRKVTYMLIATQYAYEVVHAFVESCNGGIVACEHDRLYMIILNNDDQINRCKTAYQNAIG
jgi:hypothetical protein